MIPEWKLERIINPDNAAHWSNDVAYYVNSLIKTARLALDNETSADGGESVEGRAAVVHTLEVAEALMPVVINGTEEMQHRLKIGMSKVEAA